jgi:sterol desaturase/sphingolipid hydroxylase (fatty acid hydroxylase superfamily)
MSMTVVDLLTPLLFCVLVADLLWNFRVNPGAYEAKDTLTSLLMAFGYFVIYGLYAGYTILLFQAAYSVRLFDFGASWLVWLSCFVLDDLGYYIYHRVSHRTRWFWSAHVNHHSSQYFNYATGFRQSWLTILAPSTIFKLPLLFVGFPPIMVITCAGLNAFFQFCLHNDRIPRGPRWIEFVFNTPSNHRVHHGINREYIDKNFAGVFMLWDRIFGTYAPETAKPRYGITTQLTSFSLYENVFHEWQSLWRGFKRVRGWRKILLLVSPPDAKVAGSEPSSPKLS